MDSLVPMERLLAVLRHMQVQWSHQMRFQLLSIQLASS
jgi:hypothetical protein